MPQKVAHLGHERPAHLDPFVSVTFRCCVWAGNGVPLFGVLLALWQCHLWWRAFFKFRGLGVTECAASPRWQAMGAAAAIVSRENCIPLPLKKTAASTNRTAPSINKEVT